MGPASTKGLQLATTADRGDSSNLLVECEAPERSGCNASLPVEQQFPLSDLARFKKQPKLYKNHKSVDLQIQLVQDLNNLSNPLKDRTSATNFLLDR
jgi:hypothetical protein